MSIIYDALKKVEPNTVDPQNQNPAAPPAKPVSPKGPSLLPVLGVSLLFGVFGFWVAQYLFNSIFKGPLSLVRPSKAQARAVQRRQQPAAVSVKPAPVPVAAVAPSPAVVPAPAAQPVAVEPVADEAPTEMYLNGCFLADADRFALINNKIVREGDVFQGYEVSQIREDEVDLKKGGTIYTISNRFR